MRESSWRIAGGMDSHALLVATARCYERDLTEVAAIPRRPRAYIPTARNGAQHCVDTASALGVAISIHRLDTRPPRGESVEAWARAQPLRILSSHNRLRRSRYHRPSPRRSSGNDVTAAAARCRTPWFSGDHATAEVWHGDLGAAMARDWARGDWNPSRKAKKLRWITDPSNADDNIDRNYIRNQVMPVMSARWSAASKRLAHASRLQRQAVDSLDAVADSVLERTQHLGRQQLPLESIRNIDPALWAWVLRRWIQHAGFQIPNSVHLREMCRQLNAKIDANPCIKWQGTEVRRYRDVLYVRPARERPAMAGDTPWDLHSVLRLRGGELWAESVIGDGISAAKTTGRRVTIRFRRGGERCHPNSRARSQTLKRLFQQWAVPPWERDEIPLVFIDDELVAVVGFCIDRKFVASSADYGLMPRWRKQDE